MTSRIVGWWEVDRRS